MSDRIILGLRTTMQKYYNSVPNGFWVEHSNMGSKPMTLTGLWFNLDEGVGPVGHTIRLEHKAQGPNGPR